MMTKVIIAGGRDFDNLDYMDEVMHTLFGRYNDDLGHMTCLGIHLEVVCGMAAGADVLGDRWATTNWIPVKEFPAQWDKHGKAAGAIRNVEMADYADVLVAFWDGESKGTKHMIQTALTKGLEVHVYRY
jgi:hypothetical protein